jgi:transaldolase
MGEHRNQRSFLCGYEIYRGLIGPETVNTLHPETLDAYRDHGHPASRLEHDLDRANHIVLQLKKIGVDLTELTEQLEKEGIEKFNKPYDELLQAIDEKKNSIAPV